MIFGVGVKIFGGKVHPSLDLRVFRHPVAFCMDSVACSITGSQLDYCNSLLVGISEQKLDSIQCVQSKAARIVCNAGRHSSSSDLLHSLHWLPVRHRIDFKTATRPYVLQSSKTEHSLPE